MNKDYSDIINLPHHTSPNRNPMPLRNRAAQFAPYAALSGYEDSIFEEGRVTSKKPILSDDLKTILNEKIRFTLENKGLEVEIIYFVKDSKKNGGSIASKYGIIKKIDEVEKNIILTDKSIVYLNDLLDIKNDIFDRYNF